MGNQLRTSTEQASIFKAQSDHFEKEINQKTTDSMELREQLEEKKIENAQILERYELERAALVQENKRMETHLNDINGRYHVLELEQRDVQEQHMQQGRALSVRESQMRQREQELAEQAQELNF